MREKLGLCQWFHFNAYADLDRTMEALSDLGVKHFRTGISWADYLRPGGKNWYDHQMDILRSSGMEVLLSLWHTPPSLSEGGCTNSPPRVLKDYADFVHVIIENYGDCFTALELWNEPNNQLKWDFSTYDPEWKKFGEMVGNAAYWARQQGVPTVLGGMIPVDPHWLSLMSASGALPYMDVIAIHGFPGMWWEGERNWDWCEHWHGWQSKINSIHLAEPGKPVWITETGLATWDLAHRRCGKYDLQAKMLHEAAAAPADRVYWYSVVDLDPTRSAIEGYHVDENEYHLGLIDYLGHPKPAYFAFKALMEQNSEDGPDVAELDTRSKLTDKLTPLYDSASLI